MDEILTQSYKLLPELAELGSTKEFAGAIPLERLELGAHGFRLNGGISYEVTLTNTGGDVLLAGSAQSAGVTECARCLEEAALEIRGEVEGYFILNPDEHDERLSDDEFTAVGPDGIVDLATPIIAAIISELPQAPLCREGCAGLCPICGTNLNEQQCACATKAPPDNPFSVLGTLIETQ
jgi:uncharacterized protein